MELCVTERELSSRTAHPWLTVAAERHRASIQPGEDGEILGRLVWSNPALKDHAARARHLEPVTVRRELASVARQHPVRPGDGPPRPRPEGDRDVSGKGDLLQPEQSLHDE